MACVVMKVRERPCTCDEIVPGKEWTEAYCRLCWLFHHDPHYNLLFGGKGFTRTYHGAPPVGAGTLLHRKLSWFGIVPDGECKCRDHVVRMDRWGPDKCRTEIESIVTWMREASEERGWPFVELAARHLALEAIEEAARLRREACT